MTNVRTQTGSYAYAKYQLRRSILENALRKDLTTEDHKDALKFFGGCAFCGAKQAFRKDHLIPVIHCGDFVRHNVVPACQRCDDSKGGEKVYREWMLNSNARRSLKARGFTNDQIRKRIRLIEKWRSGYEARTAAELFGKDYSTYQQILLKMERLCEESKQMTDRVKSTNREPRADAVAASRSRDAGSSADRIRRFILSRYVVPARSRGEKTVTVRAGDVHSQVSLRGQHANVCQAMRGDKFLSLANVRLRSSKGPLAGGNTYFTYQL